MEAKVYDRVAIKSVSLRRTGASTQLLPWALPDEPPAVDFMYRAKAFVDAEDSVVAVVSVRVCAEHEGEDDEDPVVEAWAEYLLHYYCEGARDLTEEQLENFAGATGLFNAWPYFREFAHSTFVRMGLPMPLLPSLSPNHGVIFGAREDAEWPFKQHAEQAGEE